MVQILARTYIDLPLKLVHYALQIIHIQLKFKPFQVDLQPICSRHVLVQYLKNTLWRNQQLQPNARVSISPELFVQINFDLTGSSNITLKFQINGFLVLPNDFLLLFSLLLDHLKQIVIKAIELKDWILKIPVKLHYPRIGLISYSLACFQFIHQLVNHIVDVVLYLLCRWLQGLNTMFFVNLRVVHTTGANETPTMSAVEGVRNVMVEASLGLSLFS